MRGTVRDLGQGSIATLEGRDLQVCFPSPPSPLIRLSGLGTQMTSRAHPQMHLAPALGWPTGGN